MIRRDVTRLLLRAHATARPLGISQARRASSLASSPSDEGYFTPRGPRSSDEQSLPGSRRKEPDVRGTGSNNDMKPRRRRVSDQEYQLRIGRAYDLLRATLPDFMRTGLVDYHHGHTSSSSGVSLLDVFTFRALRASREGSANSANYSATNQDEQVYDSQIVFNFCPGLPTSSSSSNPTSSSSIGNGTNSQLTDEEAASLSFAGRSLYFTSAHILRHTLSVIFANCRVEVSKIRLESKGDKPRVDDVLHLRLEFSGHLRVTGQEHRYTLIFRYDFDNDTGRIVRHTVERVEPAIGRKLWTGLATVWQRLIGQEPTPIPTACHVRMHRQQQQQRRLFLQARQRVGAGAREG